MATQVIRTVCAHDCPDMCSILAHVEDGRLVRVEGDPEHPFTAGFVCTKVRREPEWVHSASRVLTPLRRTGPKGAGRFEPVSWEAALDELVTRWRAIIREDGPEAILAYCYSAHQGQINRWLPMGLFHALGTTRLLAGTVCDSCAGAGWEAALGDVGGTDPEAVLESDLVVAWGADLVSTNVHFWALVERARARGAALIVVDPQRSRTAARADWHVPVRVDTDAALALGVMHVLARDGLCDRDYLARHTVGFDRLEREVLPRFAPARVAEIAGVPAADVERLAHRYGRARAPLIRIGSGMSRARRGGQAVRAVALLPGVVGAYGKPGGGAFLLTVPGFGFDFGFMRQPGGPRARREVNHARIGQALLELRDPPLRALFVASNNPTVTCPDAGTMRRGLLREDLFTVVHDPFLSETARYADLVLPAATYLETEDFFRAYGTYYLQRSRQVLPAQGQAWSNERLARELARRLDVRDPVFSMDTDALIARMFQGATGPVAAVDPASLAACGAVKAAPAAGGQRFGTPSGRLEFYSETLGRQGLPPMPDWTADPDEEAAARRWPFRLLTAPAYFQSHTAFAGNPTLRRREGPPACVLHPDDAAARGLASGDTVELFNARGVFRARLAVGDAAPRGVALVLGQPPEERPGDATVNVLCPDAYTDLGEGATYQDTRLDVRRAAAGAPA